MLEYNTKRSLTWCCFKLLFQLFEIKMYSSFLFEMRFFFILESNVEVKGLKHFKTKVLSIRLNSHNYKQNIPYGTVTAS